MVKLNSKSEFEFDLKYLSLIGTNIEVIDSKNKNQIGKKGLLVKETANFISILDETLNKIVDFHKNDLIILFTFNNKKVKLNCSILLNTIQQRIKKIK